MSQKKNAVYLQLPLPVFIEKFPEIANDLKLSNLFDLSDSNYIVRLDPINFRIEIGYTEDAWIID